MPRYLTTIHLDENNVPSDGPSPELMDRMGALIEEMNKAGVMLETAGLTPSAQGTRVLWSGGKISVTDGPFTEAKEVIGGYSILQAKNQAEAVEWSKRFLRVHEDTWTISVQVREIGE
ncbi:YciI family protein [Streptomyces sp. IB2014 016-6]|uniref:YciI family protein n=1 Tax=Streptomyces sp. IB2014 016-6 TaxID=2517818 RepID=UPI0011C77441|nr:YciI family protein [Streptomyces sp. IB2014 016-6]TXL90290.1 transcriptional regulator [Streptomyces sp. IB2014 016-6]